MELAAAFVHLGEARREDRDVARRKEDAVLRAHHLGDTADARRDHRAPGGERLDRGHREVLPAAREAHDMRGSHRRRDALALECPAEPDVLGEPELPRPLLERVPLRPLADDLEDDVATAVADERERLEEIRDRLHGDEPPNDERAEGRRLRRRARAEERGVDGVRERPQARSGDELGDPPAEVLAHGADGVGAPVDEASDGTLRPCQEPACDAALVLADDNGDPRPKSGRERDEAGPEDVRVEDVRPRFEPPERRERARDPEGEAAAVTDAERPEPELLAVLDVPRAHAGACTREDDDGDVVAARERPRVVDDEGAEERALGRRVPLRHERDATARLAGAAGSLRAVLSARQGAAEYYQGFSFDVGLRDWLVPNPRHEQLKLIVNELLDGARDLLILDVGCGAGVLSRHLTRFGRVTGVDFSDAAIALARELVPAATFHAGALDRRSLQGKFDLVTLFDVLEHVPPSEREDFFATVAGLLSARGRVLVSTPHPVHLRWLRENRPELLQVVDEPVDVQELLDLAIPHGLELVDYRTFDVDRGPREYQVALLGRLAPPGGRPIRHRRLARRMLTRVDPASRALRRAPVAARLLRTRGRRWAAWAVRPRGEPPR